MTRWRFPGRSSSQNETRHVCRRAFTLIEILVVVSVIGLLIALLLPAVQRAREAARRVECVNRLKQLGLGLAAHHAQFQHYPSALAPRWKNSSEDIRTWGFPGVDPSGLVELLPFLEESALYHSVNLTHGDSASVGVARTQNATARVAFVGAFLCPSDSFPAATTPRAPNSYRFNVGVPFSLPPAPEEGSPSDDFRQPAAFEAMHYLAPEHFRDGLSQTVGMSERLFGSQDLTGFHASRDFWYAGVSGLSPPRSADDIVEVCGSLSGRPRSVYTGYGRLWWESMYSGTWYNHLMSPNPAPADCCTCGATDPVGAIQVAASIAARSQHPGGVNALFMDGSVKFIKSSISSGVWRAVGTRDGSEPTASGID